MIDLADLGERVRSAKAAAEKRGEEMFGYSVRDDGSIIPMTERRLTGRKPSAVMIDDIAPAIPSSSRGVASDRRNDQGSLI